MKRTAVFVAAALTVALGVAPAWADSPTPSPTPSASASDAPDPTTCEGYAQQNGLDPTTECGDTVTYPNLDPTTDYVAQAQADTSTDAADQGPSCADSDPTCGGYYDPPPPDLVVTGVTYDGEVDSPTVTDGDWQAVAA